MADLTPKQIVEHLDRYIIGQAKAKRAVAVALRNRYRRRLLPREMQDEITPKNIIMVGPTGVGKTEIARRLAKLMNAPFIKVEATKFTEVGYVGRDVESMVRDLVEASIRLVKANRMENVCVQAEQLAEQRLVEILTSPPRRRAAAPPNPLSIIFGQQPPKEPEISPEEKEAFGKKRAETLEKMRRGELDDISVEVDVADTSGMGIEIPGTGQLISLSDLMGNMVPQKSKKRRVNIKEAKKILAQEEAGKLIDMDEVITEAIERAEQDGIIFIDEIDKIAGGNAVNGPDVSREGVQRDILPIVEGSTVVTKYGPVKTDYVLFIAAGAFHISKVSDLIPELQGRFPIKVELDSLYKEDFKKILTQPENAITKQYAALLSTEGIEIEFTVDAIEEISGFAQLVNESAENIGARRLHTVLENLLEELSFRAGEEHPPLKITVDAAYVREHLKEQAKEQNLQKFIL
ncbi:MAG: ATP-dependent protease ATPase subunit HslU [Bacillota bacterium]|nr:ATP-dependent protease ATPase subunit HslU [Bacillota bacterium]